MIRRFFSSPALLLLFLMFLSCELPAQLQLLGNIAGRILVAGGDVPPHQVLVELRLRGATVNSVYADMRGQFSFGALQPNPYHIVIEDDAYYPVDVEAVVNPEIPTTMVQIRLLPREETKKDDPVGARASGTNPNLVNPADYNKRFPKKAVKEYERGRECRAQRGTGRSHRAL